MHNRFPHDWCAYGYREREKEQKKLQFFLSYSKDKAFIIVFTFIFCYKELINTDVQRLARLLPLVRVWLIGMFPDVHQADGGMETVEHDQRIGQMT